MYLGQATTELTPFQKIIGVEPSAKMIEEAVKNTNAVLPGQIEYKQSAAEDLSFLKDGSVDFITSGRLFQYTPRSQTERFICIFNSSGCTLVRLDEALE
jgi:ubiquinone/menaquinone biosynthesis C-methylase UbiE